MKSETFHPTLPKFYDVHGNQVVAQNRSIVLKNCIETEYGLVWKTSEGTFTFDIDVGDDIKAILENHNPTKRQVLRTIMPIFDPVTFVAYFVVNGEILMQNIPEYSYDHRQRWSQMCV